MSKKIKLFITDLDATLTDGGFYVSEDGRLSKKFNTKDFHGLRLLSEAGVQIAIITLGTDNVIDSQIKRQSYPIRVAKGVTEKVIAAESIMKELDLCWEEVAFIGDDVNDIPLLRKVGWPSCPSDAHEEVLELEELVTSGKRAGGCGCVRNFADLVRRSLAW